MTKQEWLARCAMAYDAGFVNDDVLDCLSLGSDVLNRLVHYHMHNESVHQLEIAYGYVADEINRIKSSNNPSGTLASDRVGYGAVELAAIFKHPCQLCGTDRSAWHTRIGFCNHKEGV